jgi:hypothetical protein
MHKVPPVFTVLAYFIISQNSKKTSFLTKAINHSFIVSVQRSHAPLLQKEELLMLLSSSWLLSTYIFPP